MSQDFAAPAGDEGQARMSSGPVAIGDRPIEAGVYSWGWVEYGAYGADRRPTAISLVMFDEPTNRKAMTSLRRIARRSSLLSQLICYGPLLLAIVLVNIGYATEASWLSRVALGLAAFSGWQIWRQIRGTRALSGAVELSANRDLENYTAGRELLRLLSDPRLARDDLAAYFNLRVQSRELQKVISDDYY